MYTFMKHTQYLAPKWRAYVTPPEAGFVFESGLSIHSLWDLKVALLTLEDSIIAPSIQKDTHLLAKWVDDCIGDSQLAQVLAGTNQRWGMVVALERQMMRTLNLPDYVARRWLALTPYPFKFATGQEVACLTDLQKEMPSILESVVSFHYERYPNDLSTWLADSIGDYYLADSLIETTGKEQIMTVINDHLIMLTEAVAS